VKEGDLVQVLSDDRWIDGVVSEVHCTGSPTDTVSVILPDGTTPVLLGRVRPREWSTLLASVGDVTEAAWGAPVAARWGTAKGEWREALEAVGSQFSTWQQLKATAALRMYLWAAEVGKVSPDPRPVEDAVQAGGELGEAQLAVVALLSISASAQDRPRWTSLLRQHLDSGEVKKKQFSAAVAAVFATITSGDNVEGYHRNAWRNAEVVRAEEAYVLLRFRDNSQEVKLSRCMVRPVGGSNLLASRSVWEGGGDVTEAQRRSAASWSRRAPHDWRAVLECLCTTAPLSARSGRWRRSGDGGTS